MTGTPSLEERVAALEATVNMLTRRLFERGDITVNDARAAHGLPPFRFAEVLYGPVKDGCQRREVARCPLQCFQGPCMFGESP